MKTLALEKPFDRLLFTITLILVFIMSARAAVDTDMWWALRAGKETWDQQAPYIVDTMSYTFDGSYWNSHSWLFDVLLYACFAAGEYYGLTLLVAVLATATMALVWFQIPGTSFFRSLFLLFTSLVLAPTWTQRPQMVSMLLLSFTCLILLWFQRQQRDWLIALPPIMILWANLHAGYTLGLMIMGLVIAGEIANHVLFKNTQNQLKKFQIRKLIGIAIACGFAALLTPHGFGTWQIAFSTIGMQANDLISEWTSPDFHQASMVPFLFSLLALLFFFALRKKPLKTSDLFTTIWFTYFSLISRRQISGFGIAVMPILARTAWPVLQDWGNQLGEWWQKHSPSFLQTTSNNPQPSKANKWINFFLVAMLGFLAAGKVVYAAHPVLVDQSYLPLIFPTQAVELIQKNQYEGRLFNDYNYGGYLTWVTPDIPVYIDARADLYGDTFILQWLDIVNNQEDWNTIVQKWDIGVVLIDSNRPLAQTLHNSSQWKTEYQDNKATLFINNQNHE